MECGDGVAALDSSGARMQREPLACLTILRTEEDEGKDYGKDEGNKARPRPFVFT
ncbi:MAG: hypothetical protein ACI9X0_001138, partial [Kiritimatiellia bacterium]